VRMCLPQEKINDYGPSEMQHLLYMSMYACATELIGLKLLCVCTTADELAGVHMWSSTGNTYMRTILLKLVVDLSDMIKIYNSCTCMYVYTLIHLHHKNTNGQDRKA